MSRKTTKAVEGRDFERRDNGVIVVRRRFLDLLAPYSPERIPNYLHQVDHSLSIDRRKTYESRLKAETGDLNRLVRQMEKARRSLILVFQGRDGAGKSGAIERILQALDYDPKIFLWVPIGPPTEEELQHPYLWRFSKNDRMPKYGQVRAFDRSWAERMLVERVNKLASAGDIEASYAEIRAFEWLKTQERSILIKLWMDISSKEQLRRFKKRREEKPWKVTAADEEARERWDDYTVAANEMFHRTGTDFAPWHIVSSEDKWYSRVTVLQVINAALKEALA